MMKLSSIGSGIRLIKSYGFRYFMRRLKRRLSANPSACIDERALREYSNITGNAILSEQQAQSAALDMQATIKGFEYKPLISIVMPMYNSPLNWLEVAIRSIQAQSYANWEICAVDDGSVDHSARELVGRMSAHDKRIRLEVLKENSGISAASNKAIEMSQGEFIALMDHEDELTIDALFWIVKKINEHPDADFLYSDECKIINDTNEKYDFFLKPDWSPSYLLNFTYNCHLTVYRTELVRKIGGFRSEYDFAQDYDLALRVSDVTQNIRHVERILYFWRPSPGSAAGGGKRFARKAHMAALRDWYRRNGMDADVVDCDGLNEPRPIISEKQKVSIIISSNDDKKAARCVRAIKKNTSYPNYEIIEGLQVVSGDILCFCSEDVRPLKKDWLHRMLEILVMPGVGAVTPLRLSDKDTILSAGHITGVQKLQDSAYHNRDYFTSKNLIAGPHMIRDVSAISEICFIIRKDVFEEVGMFDSINTPDDFAGLDLSFRLRESGYRCVYTPYALMHNSLPKPSRNKADKAIPYIIEKWGKYLTRDSYFPDGMKAVYNAAPPSNVYKYYAPTKKIKRTQGGRDILIISHELSRSGAPIVLMDMVHIVIENGDWPVVVSPGDGPLRQEYLDMGVTVIVDHSIYHDGDSDLSFFKQMAQSFDLVVANTLACSRVIKALGNLPTPVLWWIHESKFGINTFRHSLPNELAENIKAYAVSEYCANSLESAGFLYNPEILLYGLSDSLADNAQKNYHETVTFLTVGSIEPTKGQDILVRALNHLGGEIIAKAQFIIIGSSNDSEIMSICESATEEYDNFTIYDSMPSEELRKWYNKADCLIIPSRADSLPVVGIESFMFSIPVICSDNVGEASFISHSINGLVFTSEDYKALAENITFAIDNREKMAKMGRKARKAIYEAHFTIEKFRENVLNVVDETIRKTQV